MTEQLWIHQILMDEPAAEMLVILIMESFTDHNFEPYFGTSVGTMIFSVKQY